MRPVRETPVGRIEKEGCQEKQVPTVGRDEFRGELRGVSS